MRISVVTPVRNGGRLIEETIRSVVTQDVWERDSVDVDYVVQDGASTDDTCAVALAALGTRGRLFSRADAGMYDALATAWRDQEPADIYCYLNAGDLMQPGALALVADTMQRHDIDWLMGQQLYFSRAGMIAISYVPFRYRRRFVEAGAYGRSLHHIQQESQYWSGSLMRTVDLDALARFRLAGDYYLWRTFAAHAAPTVIAAGLSGFRFHGGHLGADAEAYWQEIEPHLTPLGFSDRVASMGERLLWKMPWRIKNLVARPIEYHDTEDAWSAAPKRPRHDG